MSSLWVVCMLGCFATTSVLARTLQKRSSDCQQYLDLDPNHSMCLAPVGEIKTLSEDEKQAVLDRHNEYRGQVSPPAANMQKLAWDEDLATAAANWASQCQFGHDSYNARAMPGISYIGQNFAAGYADLVAATDGWASEIKDFNYGKAATGVTGHYTQIVYAKSGRVGCGVASCPDSGYGLFLVCNYAVSQMSNEAETPWAEGDSSCEDCSSQCDTTGTLCDCGGKVCANGGILDLNDCTCTCQGSYSGEYCQEINCTPDPSYCPLYKEFYGDDVCNIYYNVPQECPGMCGVC